VRKPVSSLELDVQIVAKPHPDPAQRLAWQKLWQLLLTNNPKNSNASKAATSLASNRVIPPEPEDP
jgi:hypothetical protein